LHYDANLEQEILLTHARCRADLEGLTLNDNAFKHLPTSLSSLKRLKLLSAARNGLEDGDSAFPPALDVLSPSLTSLDLSYNPLLAVLPSAIPSLSRLSTLRLGGCSLPSLPDFIFVSSSQTLTDIDLSSNSLPSLPPSLSQCSRLRSLRCSRNSITCLPPLASCRSLTLLDASSNFLSSLPTLPPSLATLHASCNRLPKLSNADADGMGRLTDLDLSSNGILTVPASLSASLS
jgi:Leucine-rich repeat (LRR) protein